MGVFDSFCFWCSFDKQFSLGQFVGKFICNKVSIRIAFRCQIYYAFKNIGMFNITKQISLNVDKHWKWLKDKDL